MAERDALALDASHVHYWLPSRSGRLIETHQRQHVDVPALATLTISALASKSGVDVETIRSYDRLGLVSKPWRTVNGLQLYPADEVERVIFIGRATDLGFPVTSIREMLGIGRKKSQTCSDIYSIAERQVADIRRRIADLRRMEEALAPLLETCPRSGGLANCPILDALSRRDDASAKLGAAAS